MAEADETLSQAKGLISAGRFDEAVDLLESWLEDNPADAGGWAALGAA
jgi:Flp pilus assembly protein TadD